MLHHFKIQELAEEVGQSFACVVAIYEAEYARLESEAKITDFLELFARRRARETLLRMKVQHVVVDSPTVAAGVVVQLP